jgi:16S rRNA (guanine527-N7)-methyltransferase
VTPDDAAVRLDAVARERGLAWRPGSALTLARFLAEVVRVSAEVNLTAAADLAQAVEVLGVPSLALGRALAPGCDVRLVIDLGSGNGMPGVVAALAFPAARVLLVERRAKKAHAALACAHAAGIANTEAVPLDGRELLARHRKLERTADLVTARGVGALADVTAMAAPWLASGGRLVHWKAADLDPAERSAGAKVARQAGLAVLEDAVFDPPRPGPGRLVVYERPLKTRSSSSPRDPA